MTNRKRAFWATTALATSMLAATAVYAQETTGGIRGQILDANDAPVAGATVVVTHVPTGTVSTTVTGPDGVYNARNLRVGGPYEVSATATGYTSEPTVVANIGIGTPANVNVYLSSTDGASTIEDVIVTGRAGALRTSPRSQFGLGDIETLPSISRDIKDFVRTSPFATVDPTNQNALSIGGQNTRFNAFLVDGIRQGDDFGLNGNGYPTQNSPISISTLEAVSVDVAPYGVQYGTFTGGVINSVTKSGSNDFQGEAFYETTNDGLRGNTFSYEDFVTGQRQNRNVGGTFEETTWGASFGGPIIRDKLFFFLNYENFESTQPVLSGPEGSGAANEVPGITQADVDQVRAIAQSVYGYDPLDWSANELVVNDEKYFAKLDWNINDRHRAVASYQQTEGGDLRLNGTVTSGSYVSVGLLSQAYTLVTQLNAYKGQLFSDWTDTFSTEFSIARKEVENVSTPLAGSDFAAFQVYLDNPTGPQPGTPERSIRFGPERSRHANALTVDTTTYRAVANWDVAQDHRLTFGFEREEQDIFNLFVQVANAEYEFASIADFQNGIASSIGYSNAATNNKEDAAATFDYALNTLFVEDEWQATADLTITGGIRYDWYTSDARPLYNQAFEDRFGFSNTKNLDGISVLQPRIGFNWRANENVRVYGGFGRFQGGAPNVWISNSYSNPGNLIGSFQCRVSTAYSSQFAGSFPVCSDPSVLQNVDGFTPPQQAQDAVTDSANLGTGNINLIDPDFESPSIWKTSLGVNTNWDLTRWGLGEGWNVTAEYVHSELENAIGWVDLSMLETQNGVAPDGRPVFGPNPVRAGQQVLMLTNFDGGKSDQVAIAVNKDWYDGWLNGTGFSLSYTYLDATDPSASTSSTASSNYGNIAVVDPNNPAVATSNYEIEHALKLNLSYQREFFGDYRTRINMFAQRRSGLPFSYTFGSSPTLLFGEGFTTTQRALLYVPQTDGTGNVTATSDPIVQYGGSFNVAAFNDFLHDTGLIRYAGQIAPRNAFNSPYVTTVDLHIAQELPAFFPGGARLEGYLDIENLGNLLNDEWGVIQQIGFPYTSNNVTATRTGDDFYTYTGFNTRSPSTFSAESVWQVKFGVRYKF
ncbi:MAG: TonB-dependent receptor [Brevundimonas sp.]|nr:TonB-dependent receptor [Brevundimonas sp.]